MSPSSMATFRPLIGALWPQAVQVRNELPLYTFPTAVSGERNCGLSEWKCC